MSIGVNLAQKVERGQAQRPNSSVCINCRKSGGGAQAYSGLIEVYAMIVRSLLRAHISSHRLDGKSTTTKR